MKIDIVARSSDRTCCAPIAEVMYIFWHMREYIKGKSKQNADDWIPQFLRRRTLFEYEFVILPLNSLLVSCASINEPNHLVQLFLML